MLIAPIETFYDGHLFRSRLEARWACFFNALGIRYQYEPQGFFISAGGVKDDPNGWAYLPDFFLPDFGTWVEVKGALDQVTDDYLWMIAWCVDWGGQLPGLRDSYGTTRGLLWLGPIPSADQDHPVHPILQHSKGGWFSAGWFSEDGQLCVEDGSGEDYFDSTWGITCGTEIRETLRRWVYDPYAPYGYPGECPPAGAEGMKMPRPARGRSGQAALATAAGMRPG